MNDWNPLLQILFVVVLWYATYGLISFLFTVLFRRFLISPVLAHKEGIDHRTIWKHSLKWGFWVIWEYLIALLLLAGYTVVFRCVRFLSGYDLTATTFWNEKEKRYLNSTPRTLLLDWAKEYFAKLEPRE